MGSLAQTSAQWAQESWGSFLGDEDLWRFWSLGPSGTYPESRAKPPKFSVAGGKPSLSLAPQTPGHPQSSPAAGPDSPTCAGVLGVPGAIFRTERPKAGTGRCHWRCEAGADRLRVRSVGELPSAGSCARAYVWREEGTTRARGGGWMSLRDRERACLRAPVCVCWS